MAQQSLADLAVTTLAELKQIEAGMKTDAEERFAIWRAKEAAEQAIRSGCEVALNILTAARFMREAVPQIEENAIETQKNR